MHKKVRGQDAKRNHQILHMHHDRRSYMFFFGPPKTVMAKARRTHLPERFKCLQFIRRLHQNDPSLDQECHQTSFFVIHFCQNSLNDFARSVTGWAAVPGWADAEYPNEELELCLEAFRSI